MARTAPTRSAYENDCFGLCFDLRTMSTDLPASLSFWATSIAGRRIVSLNGMTKSWTSASSEGINPLTISNSLMTQSPNPNPQAGIARLWPYVCIRLSYRPPPQIALSSPALSKHSNTTPV
eukprot:gene14754-biopygen14820